MKHTPKRGGTQAAQRARADQTRIALLHTARAMFAELGYHDTGTVALVEQAQVTSGALYHHFRDKKTLFEAVFLEVLVGLRLSAEHAARQGNPDRWHLIAAGFDNYIRLAAASAEFQRIVLIDGPVVLGWTGWRALLSEQVTTGIETSIVLLIEDGEIAAQPVASLANLLQAALNEAVLSVAHATDRAQTQQDVALAFRNLLYGLRLPPEGALPD